MSRGGVLRRGLLGDGAAPATAPSIAQYHGQVVGPVLRQKHEHETDEDEQDSGQLHAFEHHFVDIHVYDCAQGDKMRMTSQTGDHVTQSGIS